MRISREKVSEFEWLSNPNTFYVFMRLLFKASFKDGRWEGVDIKKGQLITGRKALSVELNLSEQQIRTCLDKLQKTGYITIKSTNKYSIITICDYDSWQCEDGLTNQQNNQQSTSNQPTNNQQITTIEEIKELKEEINKLRKEKEELTSVSEKKEKEKVKKEKDEKFEECWLAYSRKGSKAKSLEYWNKLSDADKELVLPHIKAYVGSREKRYQKDFERYLRDKIFKNIVVKGNDTIYDPERLSSPDEYRPIADGVFLVWNDDRKCLLFNGYIDQLNDGYTPENRPDGAKVASGMYEWIWSGITKEWVISND